MPADLTLPGSIPGLLRRGSPVFWRDEITPSVVTWIGPWPDCDPDDGAIALIAPGSEPCIGMAVNACSDLVLDLSDATGRAHAAWWLATHVPHEFGALDPSEGVRWHRSHRGYWELHCQRADEHRRWQEVAFLPRDGDWRLADQMAGPNSSWSRFVPALAALDPNDPRLLPDGSRWVDAEALRLVCLHVAVVAP